MITVIWPSVVSTSAEVWRVLDLSGITRSPRESKLAVRSGVTFLNGKLVNSIRETVDINTTFVLEIRLPSGRIISKTIKLVNLSYSSTARSRNLDPTVLNRKG